MPSLLPSSLLPVPSPLKAQTHPRWVSVSDEGGGAVYLARREDGSGTCAALLFIHLGNTHWALIVRQAQAVQVGKAQSFGALKIVHEVGVFQTCPWVQNYKWW